MLDISHMPRKVPSYAKTIQHQRQEQRGSGQQRWDHKMEFHSKSNPKNRTEETCVLMTTWSHSGNLELIQRVYLMLFFAMQWYLLLNARSEMRTVTLFLFCVHPYDQHWANEKILFTCTLHWNFTGTQNHCCKRLANKKVNCKLYHKKSSWTYMTKYCMTEEETKAHDRAAIQLLFIAVIDISNWIPTDPTTVNNTASSLVVLVRSATSRGVRL